MQDAQIFVGLLVAAALLTEVAQRLRVAYPIVLVLAGLALGFVPGLPAPTLDPEVFFFVFLPPLVYSEAFLYSTEHLRANRTEILLLAVGLVLATTLGVAVVAHEVVGLEWPAAFVLGAVVGPTDPVAATAVIRRLGVPERMVSVLEGEALVNDGTALVALKLAVGAAAASSFSIGHAAAEAVWIILGGVAVGALVALAWRRVRRWTTVAEVDIAISLALPFAAYFPAERLGVSGVLAAVTAGLMVGRELQQLSPGTRLKGHAFWQVLVFLLNSTLFLLLGLTFPDVLARLDRVDVATLVWGAIAVCATVMLLRLAWMALLRPLFTRGEMVVLGWSGMRGGVSLAAALSVPVLAGGQPFPGRDEIIFLTYMVLLATLIVPGLTLGKIIDRLNVGAGETVGGLDAAARAHILRAAIEHIEEVVENEELPEELALRLIQLYESQLDRLASAPEREEAA
jgi:Na+/H+ antiporter